MMRSASIFLRAYLPALAVSLLLLSACGSAGPELTQEQQDSVSKISQRLRSDSLRKSNPLLIVPPDSDYTGDYVDKYPSGVVKFRGQFRFGERHGHWLSFFPNGELWSEMHYDKGLREGPNNVYNEKGMMLYSGFYKNDRKDSIWTYYDSTGHVAQKLQYRADRIVKKME